MDATRGRRRVSGEATSASSGPAETSATKLVFGLSSRTNRVKHAEYAESRRASQTQEPAAETGDCAAATKFACGPSSGQQQVNGSVRSSVRASKYGNYYRPQDLREPAPERASGSAAVRVTTLTGTNTLTFQMVPPSAKTATPASDAKENSPDERRARPKGSSKSPVRRKSVDRDKQPKGDDVGESQQQVKSTRRKSIESPESPKPKMMFSIPPPPKVSTTKGSVVSYAKSRIYDRPANRFGFGAQNTNASASLELGGTGEIPKAILSGFKPPKQVNVSKAREKWEGGEPFARCKSRQRLAAQAGKRLLHGTWSMTSVVATQQLHLQQALAAANATKPNLLGTNYLDAEPSVKVLTRGSVLERVQQFERSPSASNGSPLGGNSSTGSSGSSTPTSGSSDSLDGEDDRDEAKSVDEASITIDKSISVVETAPSAELVAGSRQAQYKSRVSSIQVNQNQPQQAQDFVTNLLNHSPPMRSPSGESAFPFGSNLRRPSLRRRSSVASNNSGTSLAASIPRFYHPNGKPNTYEIELQKKNIVACFDKFPERKASLAGPNYRRHFQSIVGACGFSEYFKEPMGAYIKHQMRNSNLLHNTTASSMLSKVSRKQSSAGLNGLHQQSSPATSPGGQPGSPEVQQQPRQLKPLARAASIDTSTMEKLANQTYVTCDQFLVCWLNMINCCFDQPSRFIHLLTFGQRNYLVPDDFVPLIQSIIDDHPGLKFLRAAPDFHMRYIQTVIARIYFCVNRSWTGKISLVELRRSNLLAVLQVLSQEEDINQITDYFSYEHFYVIYCKFWNLDQDHDLLISKDDLARHNDASISSRVIDRIFSGVISRQIAKTGKMSYTDFVWFLIAEEDKKHPRSVEYWFRLLDIDGDGYISMYEMEYFYYEQIRRLELMNIEALPFLDSACQILDLVNPKEKNKISLSDLKQTKLSTIFFDTFINLEKYLEHESREFVSSRDVVQDGVVVSDWDRYASEEYENLVSEESSV